MKDLTKLFASVGVAVVVICTVASTGAHAAGFAPLSLADTGDVCYTWEGGHGSAGSYSRCSPVIVLAQAAPPKTIEVVKEVPVLMKADCPAPMSAPAPRKPIVKRKPKVQC